MGGDASLWQGLWTPRNKEQALELLTHAFGCDTMTPSMVSRWYRDKYPELWKEVMNAAAN